MADLKLDDIQGFILNGYRFALVRYFVLQINNIAAAKRFIGALVNGDPASSPQITTASRWTVAPDSCLNIGLTYEGLSALQLPDASLSTFPSEFKADYATIASNVDDTGESAPENWVVGGPNTPTPHMLLVLYAQSSDVLESKTTTLRTLFAQQGAISELSHHDGNALPLETVHFGYKDGISQPTIDGVPSKKLPDSQLVAPPGEFLLGYHNQFSEIYGYSVPKPEVSLGNNGSFAAFRILKQEVDAFEQFLRDTAPKVGMSVEMLAAKLCGRWRNGVPLVLSPDTDIPDPPIAEDQVNNYDYVPGDVRGYRCPIGAHMRRSNPRGESIAGGDGHKRRIVRRGMPYGPPYDPTNPNDGIERGLLGLFINVSLKDQFEFIMSTWLNDGDFAGINKTRDPLVGNNTPGDSRFLIPGQKGTQTVTGFPRFVITRGSIYCFLPSITALKYLANL
ncbi:MAG: Dyp-type peroxidase [Ktedonobacteraceae bacterium]